MSDKRVILYSQPGCPPCFAAKSYLKAKKIAFEYKDVQADPVALRELMARLTPSAAKAAAIARPIPLVAPVIIAFFIE